MFYIRTVAVGIVLGSLLAWHDAAYEHIVALPGFPAYVQWALIVAVFWAMGVFAATLIWRTVEQLAELFLYSAFPALSPNRRLVLLDGHRPGAVWANPSQPKAAVSASTDTQDPADQPSKNEAQ